VQVAEVLLQLRETGIFLDSLLERFPRLVEPALPLAHHTEIVVERRGMWMRRNTGGEHVGRAVVIAQQRGGEGRKVEPRRRWRSVAEERTCRGERRVGARDVAREQRHHAEGRLHARIRGAAATRGFLERQLRLRITTLAL